MRFDAAQQTLTPFGRVNGEKLDAHVAVRASGQPPDAGKLSGAVLQLLGQLRTLLQEYSMVAGGNGNAAGLSQKLRAHDEQLKGLAGEARGVRPPAHDYGTCPPAYTNYSRFDSFPNAGAGMPPGKGPATMPTATSESVKPTAQPISPEQARINTEKVQGIGHHPLGADDDLVPEKLKGKSVAEIRKEYPILANLGNQEGVRDKLKQVVGDIDNDPKAFMRGVAYLNKIKNLPNPDGSARPESVIKNGKMEGATKDGDIRSGTELAILKDSFKGGPGVPDSKAPEKIDKGAAYGWLNQQKALAHTNDPHVKNGGNFVSPAAVVGQKILNGVADVFDFAGGLVNKTIGKIPGLGKVAGLLTDVVTGGVAGGLRVAGVAAVGGDVKAAGIDMGKDMLQNTVENVVGIVDVTGVGAREVGKLARNELDKAIPSTNDGDKSSASGFENRKPDEKKSAQDDNNNNNNNNNGNGGGRGKRA